MEPVISVVVPVYNGAGYLEACFASLAAQTYRRIEVIAVDDASTDKSGALCDRWAEKDPRFQAVHLPENRGPSGARNEGVRRAKGECLSFVDADDFAEPQLLERMYRRLTEAGADVCACGAEGIRIKDGPPGVFSREEAVRCLARSQPFGFVPWGKLYRTALVKDCPFDEGIFYSEDLLFLYQLFQRVEKVCYLPDRLYHYVCREGGQMQSGINRRKCTALAVNDRICEDAALRFPEAETDFRQTALEACRCLAVLAVKKGASEGRLWNYLKLLQGNLRRHFSWKALARCPRKKDAAAILALSVSAAAFWGLAAAMGKGGRG